MRWPIWGSRFNTRDYPSNAMIIDDIETILEISLQISLNINRREYKVLPFGIWLRIHIEKY